MRAKQNGRLLNSCVKAQLCLWSDYKTFKSILVIRYCTKMMHEYIQVSSFLVASPVATIAMPPHVWVNAGMALKVIEANKNCESVRLLLRRGKVRCTAPDLL
jgi:hypothetical protein